MSEQEERPQERGFGLYGVGGEFRIRVLAPGRAVKVSRFRGFKVSKVKIPWGKVPWNPTLAKYARMGIPATSYLQLTYLLPHIHGYWGRGYAVCDYLEVA
jgi:hypothetical protein